MINTSQEIGSSFNNQFNKVSKDIDNGVFQEAEQAVRLENSDPTATSSTYNASIIAFPKIDINKAVDSITGLLNGPIANYFIAGYPYSPYTP
jgi:hypothetical protein